MPKHTDQPTNPISWPQTPPIEREPLTTLVAHGRHRVGRLVGLSAPLLGQVRAKGWPLWWPYAWAFANRSSSTPQALRNFR